GVLRAAAMKGYDSTVTGIGPVTLGTRVGLTAKSNTATTANMLGLLVSNAVKDIQYSRIKQCNLHITRSCPHVHFALRSNSFVPLGVAFGLCRVCLLKTTPNSRNNSSRLAQPYVKPGNSIPSLFTSQTTVFSLFTTSFRSAFNFPTSRRKNCMTSCGSSTEPL